MKIICLGDSFTEGYLVENKSYTRFLSKAGFDVVNLGVNGSSTEEMLDRYEGYILTADPADLLIIFGGTNDFMVGHSVDLVFKNLKSIVDLAKAGQILLVIPPFLEEDEYYPIYGEINAKIASLKEKIKTMGLSYIDADTVAGHYLDGIHLASDFHEGLAKKIIGKIGE